MTPTTTRLVLGSVGTCVAAVALPFIGVHPIAQGLILGTANFWLGVYWARDSIAAGTMNVPGQPGIRWESWKDQFRKFRK